MTFVEVLDRRGRVRGRVKVTSLPFRIGRGYDCDLILDDPHVSPLHAVLEQDTEGRLLLRDAASRNGVRVGGRVPVERIALDGDVSVEIGRTLLRLRPADFRVPEALPIVRRSRVSEWLLEHWTAAIVVPLASVAVEAFDQYRKSSDPFEASEAISAAAWGLLVFIGWIGAWALLNRLLRHRTRFVAHATVAFGASIVYMLMQWGFEWLHFLFAPVEPQRLAELVATTALLSLVLFAHLTVMGVALRRVRVAVVGVGFAGILSLQLLDHYNDDMDWVMTLPYWSRLEPLDPAWLPVESPDAFFAGAAELAGELDALAREALEEQEEDADPEELAPDPEDETPPMEPVAARSGAQAVRASAISVSPSDSTRSGTAIRLK